LHVKFLHFVFWRAQGELCTLALHRGAEQVLDLDAEAGVQLVRQPLPVAMGGVALIA
jgi:hypothetical protein